VVWCGVVWSGVVWCGVVWCGVEGERAGRVGGSGNSRVVSKDERTESGIDLT